MTDECVFLDNQPLFYKIAWHVSSTEFACHVSCKFNLYACGIWLVSLGINKFRICNLSRTILTYFLVTACINWIVADASIIHHKLYNFIMEISVIFNSFSSKVEATVQNVSAYVIIIIHILTYLTCISSNDNVIHMIKISTWMR